MVIFGAGASYDSAQAYRPILPRGGGGANFGNSAPDPVDDGGPWRPPLAKDLFLDRHHAFGAIVTKYRKLTHILPNLREPSNGRSVEQMLEFLQEEGKGNPESQREFASVRFYLCELLTKVTAEWSAQTNGVTNYAPLVKDILRFTNSNDQVCLVTFNYDLLLERALYTFGFARKEPEEHLRSHPTLKLFKLHGSVEWSRLVDTDPALPSRTRLTIQDLIDKANILRLSNRFVLANATNLHQVYDFERPIFPAIAIPVQTKSDEYFECPRAHLDSLNEMLPEITKILIVGWQAREAHFLQMLRSKLPRLDSIMVVGASASDAEGILRHFSTEIRYRVAREYVADGGFTSFIVNQDGHDFFKR